MQESRKSVVGEENIKGLRCKQERQSDRKKGENERQTE